MTDKGLRHNEGKVKVELVPPRWVLALAEVLTKGAEKYAERNWEKGMEWSKCYASAQRHLLAFWDGEDLDKETGLSHVAHAAWNCLALLTYSEEHQEDDNRPTTKNQDTRPTFETRGMKYHVVRCSVSSPHSGHSWTVHDKYPRVRIYWCHGQRQAPCLRQE